MSESRSSKDRLHIRHSMIFLVLGLPRIAFLFSNSAHILSVTATLLFEPNWVFEIFSHIVPLFSF